MKPKEIIYKALPTLEEKKARKKIYGDENHEHFGASGIDTLTVDVLRKLYEREMDTKKSLEDKAKINIIGITITITLMMQGYSFLSPFESQERQNGLYFILVSTIVISTLYFLIAGMYSIRCLNDENTFYFIQPHNMDADNKEARKDFTNCIIENRKHNLVRNNMINVSYQCMRNGLILLFISFTATLTCKTILL